MTQTLFKYTFSASGPLPDENGVIMQGTAYRVDGCSGELLAHDMKQATSIALNVPLIKAIADYNKIDIEPLIAQVNPSQDNVLSLLPLDTGMTVSFSLSKKEEYKKEA